MNDNELAMYYLQSRYYDPEVGRFLNADVLVSTGQGLLGYNMFAYCNNNPAIYLDRDGRSLDQVDFDSREDLDEQDIGPTGAGSQWSMFTSTMRSAVKGLNMAMGMKNTSSTEKHHAASNKNKTYTPQFKEIFDRYNMSLNAEENIIPLEGHSGRHTNAYHNFILMSLSELDAIARGNSQLFYEGFMLIVDFVRDNPWLPYAK